MPQPLSKKAERTILESIQEVVGHVGEDMSPTDAVTKVAQDRQLTRDYVNLVCTGYNTGATNFQRENESGVLNKLADFPLADATKVAQELWPAKVETPVEKSASTVVSDDYSAAPRPVFRPSATLEKAAQVDAQFEKAPPLPRARDRVDDAFEKRSALRANTEQLRKNASDAQSTMLSELSWFSQFVKYASPIERQQLAYALREVHGPAGEALMKYAAIRNRIELPEGDPEAFRIDWTKHSYAKARDCLAATNQVSEAKTAYLVGKDANDTLITETMSPFAQTPMTPGVKLAASTGGIMSGVVLKSLLDQYALPSAVERRTQESAESTDAASSAMSDEMADPDHENAIRRIRAQTMLSDLMSNDEVISGYDPNEVLDAYNEVSQLSPMSATQPALVRPWLRKRLSQGAVEPFEAAEMANVEKTLSQTQNQTFPDPKVANVLDTSTTVVR